MSHSKEHMRQKEMARKEAMDHYHNANVMHPRMGMRHEEHKERQMDDHADEFRGKGMNHQSEREEMHEHGYKVKMGESC